MRLRTEMRDKTKRRMKSFGNNGKLIIPIDKSNEQLEN